MNRSHLRGYQLNAAEHRMLTVMAPDGSKTEYIHNRDFRSILDGKLIVTNHYDTNGTRLLQSQVDRYDDAKHRVPKVGRTYVAII